MADKRIQDLTPASSIQTNDLFVLEQSGAAKSLTGQILINDLATYLDGHGGISDIVYTPPVAPSLDGTLTITMADETVYSVTVKNGNGITSIGVSYGISNNGTDPTTVQSWGATVTPPTNQYPYVWTRIRLNQTTGIYTDSYSVTVKADDPSITVGTVSAQPGLNASASITNSGTANDPVLNFSFELPQGDKGDTGDYIVPVVSYGTSTAAATEPVTWYNDPSSISYSAGNFVWKKTEYTLHDAQTVQDTVKEIIGYIGQNGSGAGTVTQITFNGTVYADDGTGNVPMTIDAEDVGAIADPTTKSNGQVLTYDSSAGEWVAANPSTGNVNTVNSKGVDAGTTNITLYATDIKMSSSDSTTIPNAMPKPQTSGTPANLGTAARGSATTFSRSDHVHNLPSGLVPSGGNSGEVLTKSSSTDYDTAWASHPYGAQVDVLSGTHDLNDYTAAGLYYFSEDTTLSNAPGSAVDGWLTVYVSGSNSASVKQIWVRQGSIPYNFRDYYMRCKDSGTWGSWYSISPGENNVLWTGGYYMSGAQTIDLAEPISKQKTGIVLCWSAYASGSPQNYDWVYHFVPKWHVANFAGSGTNFFLSSMNNAGQKYLYISDSSITGYSENDDDYTGSASKIGFRNTYWVLRAVVGV